MRLLDREAELEALEVLLRAARGGSGGALLIEGPAGIGKSSLLDAARASASGFRAVAARATELDRALPFGVVRQLLEPAPPAKRSPTRTSSRRPRCCSRIVSRRRRTCWETCSRAPATAGRCPSSRPRRNCERSHGGAAAR